MNILFASIGAPHPPHKGPKSGTPWPPAPSAPANIVPSPQGPQWNPPLGAVVYPCCPSPGSSKPVLKRAMREPIAPRSPSETFHDVTETHKSPQDNILRRPKHPSQLPKYPSECPSCGSLRVILETHSPRACGLCPSVSTTYFLIANRGH